MLDLVWNDSARGEGGFSHSNFGPGGGILELGEKEV